MTPGQSITAQVPVTLLTKIPAVAPLMTIVPPLGLTPREMDVLRLLARGMTSVQISEQLTISVLTVNGYIRSIYSKLGVTSRSAATRYALEHRLV